MMTVISEQVIKDQGATSLTDMLKNVPDVGAFFAGESGSSTTGDAIYMRSANTSSGIYIDDARDVNNVSRDTSDTEQVEVIKGLSGTDYGRSAPIGPTNMISKQPRNDPDIDVFASIGSAWFRRGALGVNQVVGDTTAVRLNVVGERTHDTGRGKAKNGRYGIAPPVAFGLGTTNHLYFNYLHVTQHNTPNGGIPTIDLPSYPAPSAGITILNHPGKVDTRNFYDTDSSYNDSTADTATMRFEHDINDNTTTHNTTCQSHVRQDYLMATIMGGTSNITQPTSDVNNWTQSRTANTRDVSNKILANQINLTPTLYTGAIGRDFNTGVEFTHETQTNYGASPVTLPAVNIYHPDSSIHPDGLACDDANASDQTDTFATYAFDTLQITYDFELSGGTRLDNYHTEYNSVITCGGSGRDITTYLAGVARDSPVTTVDTTKPGDLVNQKIRALYHLAENGNIYTNYAVSQQSPGGSDFIPAQSGSGNSANHIDFKPQRANISEIGTKWQVLDKCLLLTAMLFRTDIENEVEQNGDGTYSQYDKKRVEGCEISVARNITLVRQMIGGYTRQRVAVKNDEDVARDGSPSLPYTSEHAFALWSQYQVTDDTSVGAGARHIGSMRKGSDDAVGTLVFTEGYWVADTELGYRVNCSLDFQLNIYNLFDTDYVTSINKSGYRYHPGEPRTFLFIANMHF